MKPPPFVQIAVGNEGDLFGLDQRGTAWVFNWPHSSPQAKWQIVPGQNVDAEGNRLEAEK